MEIADLLQDLFVKKEFKDIERTPRFKRNSETPVEELPSRACCGNCANLTYSGINEIKLEWGVCEAYDRSERFCNKHDGAPCQFWRPRSKPRMANERAYADKMREIISNLNASVQRGGQVGKIAFIKRPKELSQHDPNSVAPAREKRKKVSAEEGLAMLGIGLGFDDTSLDDEDNDMDTMETEEVED